jgi:hypothetical protein
MTLDTHLTSNAKERALKLIQRANRRDLGESVRNRRPIARHSDPNGLMACLDRALPAKGQACIGFIVANEDPREVFQGLASGDRWLACELWSRRELEGFGCPCTEVTRYGASAFKANPRSAACRPGKRRCRGLTDLEE